MRFGSTAKVLAERKLKYYGISECDVKGMRRGPAEDRHLMTHHAQGRVGGGHAGVGNESSDDARCTWLHGRRACRQREMSHLMTHHAQCRMGGGHAAGIKDCLDVPDAKFVPLRQDLHQFYISSYERNGRARHGPANVLRADI